MTDADLQRLMQAATAAQRAGRRDEALRLFRAVIAVAEQPLALNVLGVDALGRRDWTEAAGLFRRAIAADPAAPELWMNLARCAREAGDKAGERRALEGALSIDRRHFMALVRMAELDEREGRMDSALTHWTGVLAMSQAIEAPSPSLTAVFDHARAFVAGHRASLASSIDEGMADVRGGLTRQERRRFDACMDHMLGRRAIFANACAGLHFPFLPADEYFDRAHFPWLDRLEAETPTIRAELEALLAMPEPGLSPYVEMPAGTPDNKWSSLNHRLSWGALHLWRHGRRIEANCARAPRTAAIIDRLPLAHLAGRTPTVFFSILQPGTRLPPHTGVSNIRAIIHLPLIVPPDGESVCGFRVGGETRGWREGEAFAFDDTIEHEAWNLSDAPRAILILDTWNPHLTAAERDLLARFADIAPAGEGQVAED
ncbi:aspartyl/asparaginyl beta-hydroxylase domain-containing protein [Sphingomonas jatrophae]|uniref:Tetratricopeptide repeat-containing protein n=1 Tax=Sphingomonas jatrophae TaxID=1166337 RepID=A0A1I6M751_9SPHN|nr:aspartyl/asparaginyl beta-hydroxylase domain-containing protein [Sphingomonas jatrophae]SFS11453.1 Tetratricopeptide repeat-containing protein [Sphingomonas jatrophae]